MSDTHPPKGAPLADQALEDLFSAAQSTAPVSEGLRARILADADAVLEAETKPAAAAASSSWWSNLWQELGGWPAAAGLATATVAGIWIGGVQPDLPSTLLSIDASTTSLDSFFPDYDTFLEEI